MTVAPARASSAMMSPMVCRDCPRLAEQEGRALPIRSGKNRA
ncbi:MAG: hypothetical protein ACLR7Z_09055 [Bilophila wadsworthia]